MAGTSKALWSKTTRIKLMIIIDTTFFLIELISGLLSHSLALTADAFHMLNDIISLVIGLWAVIASQKATTDEYTFGWVRAEILGAFFNAVFLIALCVSIILEAFTRFFEPPVIDNPKLILIVGSTGLASNLLGFLVLGGHGHEHGHDHDHDEEHGHAHDHQHEHAGHAHRHDVEESLLSEVAGERGEIADYLPEAIVARATMAGPRSSSESNGQVESSTSRDQSHTRSGRTSGQSHSRGRNNHRRSSKAGHSRFASIDDMSIHPASFRQDIIAASLAASSPGGGGANYYDSDGSPSPGDAEVNERSSLLDNAKGVNYSRYSGQASKRPRRDSSVHDGHNHTLPRKPGSKVSGHSHADMGMNAMALHVLGDALGNIGVIVSALVILLTDWPGKYYADPAVSLFITLIILKTSIPLTLATSRVLLQAVPENLNIQEIRQDIEGLPGVVSCHHVHVWQLSDTKVVASLHLQVSFPIDSHSGEKYMQLAKRARKCLHAYGIHSATIQPEFYLDQEQQNGDVAAMNLDGGADAPSNVCLLECVEDCEEQGCCTIPEGSSASSTRRASESSRSGASPH